MIEILWEASHSPGIACFASWFVMGDPTTWEVISTPLWTRAVSVMDPGAYAVLSTANVSRPGTKFYYKACTFSRPPSKYSAPG